MPATGTPIDYTSPIPPELSGAAISYRLVAAGVPHEFLAIARVSRQGVVIHLLDFPPAIVGSTHMTPAKRPHLTPSSTRPDFSLRSLRRRS
jgi:hypothetical protein